MSNHPELLLHVCCAPCSLPAIQRLRSEYAVQGFFHNPNIHPQEEYLQRLQAAQQLATEMQFTLVVPDYRPDEWDLLMLGFEAEPEGGRRCARCFEQNLKATALQARTMGIPYFSTTLTLSPHKSSETIFAIGTALGNELGVEFVARDFKLDDGFRISVENSRAMKLYRQHYCGCRFSWRPSRHA